MSPECKHGLKAGCAYCHAYTPAAVAQPGVRKRSPSTNARMSDKMNDRMTALKKRLREIRGE